MMAEEFSNLLISRLSDLACDRLSQQWRFLCMEKPASALEEQP